MRQTSFAQTKADPIIRINMTARSQTRTIIRENVMLIRATITSFRIMMDGMRDGLIDQAKQIFDSRLPLNVVLPEQEILSRMAQLVEILTASEIAGRLNTRRRAEAQFDEEQTFPRGLPPRKAISYLKKLPSVRKADWEAAAAKFRRPAFFIAGIENRQILEIIRTVIEESLREGLSLEKFEQRVRNRLWTLRIKGGHLRTVWHMNVSNAYRAGRYEELQQPEIKGVLTHYLFDAIVDGVVRPNHKALENGIAPINWPGWEKYRDPLGFNCRCQRIAISSARARRMIESGQGWDMTLGVPANAGPDEGFVRMV